MKQDQDKYTKQVLRERARALAKPLPEEHPEVSCLDVVVFLLADEKYGVETGCVREVYPLKELTPVPCTPAFVMGIASIRGKITSVIDLKTFFDLPLKGLTELDKVVVVEANGIEVGIHADAIVGLQSIPVEKLQGPLPTLTGVREKYLKGVTPERLAVLDAARLLADPAIIVQEEV